MNTIKQVEELMALPGRRIAFMGSTFNPPNFRQLNFIKKIAHFQHLNHIVVCPHSKDSKLDITEIKQHLRIMDFMLGSQPDSNISILSPELCDGVHNKILMDDIFYLLKRRKKEIFILLGCDYIRECIEFFKSFEVTYIVDCQENKSEIENYLFEKKVKFVFSENLIPSPPIHRPEPTYKKRVHLSYEQQTYLEQNDFFDKTTDYKNCN